MRLIKFLGLIILVVLAAEFVAANCIPGTTRCASSYVLERCVSPSYGGTPFWQGTNCIYGCTVVDGAAQCKSTPVCINGARKCENNVEWVCFDGKWVGNPCQYGCSGNRCATYTEPTPTTIPSTSCVNGQTQPCLAPNGCQGVQTCQFGSWSECVSPLQLCNDGSCRPSCISNSSIECQVGDARYCTTKEGARGKQTCVNGKWAECVLIPPIGFMFVFGLIGVVFIVVLYLMFRKVIR